MIKHEDVTDKILGCFYTVYNTLGYGFLEKVYEKAMVIELRKNHCLVASQQSIGVFYDNQQIGSYSADLIVDNKVIVELKAAATLLEEHEAQLLNYLKATQMEVGLLLNFGAKPEIRRKIFSNSRK